MLLNGPSVEISFLELERAKNPCHPKIKKKIKIEVQCDTRRFCRSKGVSWRLAARMEVRHKLA